MKNLARVSAVVAGVLVATGVLTVACGSSSVGILPDASTDAPADHFVKKDTGGKPDSTTPPKDGGTDVTVTPDTGVDAGTDTGIDTGHDAGHDVGVDAPGFDAGPDAGPPGPLFPAIVTNAYCTRMSTCCVGDASATFNEAKCVSDQVADEVVPLTTLGLITNGVNSPNYTFNQANADACLAAIAALSCSSNSATTLASVASTCASAYQPKLGSGGTGCQSSFDCPSGTYCGPFTLDAKQLPIAAAGATCLPLAGLGGACADTNLSSDCSYLSDGTPAQYCWYANASATSTTCLASKAAGADCTDTYEGVECLSGQCQPDDGMMDYGCETTAVFNLLEGTNLCTAYPLP